MRGLYASSAGHSHLPQASSENVTSPQQGCRHQDATVSGNLAYQLSEWYIQAAESVAESVAVLGVVAV